MKINKRIIIYVLGISALILLIFFFFKSSTKKKKGENGQVTMLNPDSVPMLDTDSLTMLISDSGLVRYKVVAETWKVFDRVKTPYWLFPDGFYLEQFDTTFQIVATVKSDTAWNFSKKRLWKLRGNVRIENNIGETFDSEELYWDERRQKVYSEEYVEIHRPDKGILRGQGGFEANQQMTEYTFKKLRDTEIFVKDKATETSKE